MTTLDELRERLEKAEGPDRQFDYDLYGAFFNKYAGDDFFDAVIPPYTASLDAAIALANAKGMTRRQMHMTKDHFTYWLSYEGATCWLPKGRHKSEPIALLLALLSALEKESAE